MAKPSKWITLTAVLQLKRCAGLVRRIADGEEFALPAKPPKQPTFAPYPFTYARADEKRERARWAEFGMGPVLERLVSFAHQHALATGWRWGFVMGPRSCPEWCAAEVRWVPRKGAKKSWPVSRVYFMTRRAHLCPEGLSERTGIPVEDEAEKRRFKEFFWNSLWRVRTARWKGDYDEVGVTLRSPDEIERLESVLGEALRDLLEAG